MHVKHLYHSGFLITLDGAALLFDWYPTTQERLMADLALFPRTGRLYVFVSHIHHDHFLPSIWKLDAYLRDAEVTFIVDSAVAGYAPPELELDTVACEPEQIYEIDEFMEVTTLNSTDEGVAFCVDIDGRTVYHAGDLSVWWWPERDVALNRASEQMCRYFLEILEGRHIDLAMLPITPRAGSDGDRGIELFMQQVGADTVVPMHYLDDLAGAKALAGSTRLSPWWSRITFEDDFDL